nr:protein transport protein SEC24-like CEF [Tanacetum cinerariifolium]
MTEDSPKYRTKLITCGDHKKASSKYCSFVCTWLCKQEEKQSTKRSSKWYVAETVFVIMITRVETVKGIKIKGACYVGSECWPITKALANKTDVAELRMLRWTCGKTMLDMIPNGVYKAELEMETITNKMREGQLFWFGHVRRRPQSAPVRRVEALVVDGMRRRGRPKLRWEDKVKVDMKELLLSEDMTSNRNEWRARTSLRG